MIRPIGAVNIIAVQVLNRLSLCRVAHHNRCHPGTGWTVNIHHFDRGQSGVSSAGHGLSAQHWGARASI